MYLLYLKEIFVWYVFGVLIWLVLLKRDGRKITPWNVGFAIAYGFLGGFVVLLYHVFVKYDFLDPPQDHN
jgi:hypothetical protein